jgi:hypothetical protein
MAIDYAKAKHFAAELKRLLEHYAAEESEAATCLRELSPLIDGVIAGTATLPVSKVACSWHFHEGELRKYSELESAYSSFAVAVRGDDVEKMRRLVQRLDTDPKFSAQMLSPALTWREKIWSRWVRFTHRVKR